MQYLVLILCACSRPVTICRCPCHDPEEEKPVVANFTVSDVSWDSFLLSWSADNGVFQAFLITVFDAETGSAWQNHTVSGDAQSLAISGLLPTTWYRVSLHGLYRGTLSDPVIADTITGTTSVTGVQLSLLLGFFSTLSPLCFHQAQRYDVASFKQLYCYLIFGHFSCQS